jgi:signal transduction histidine kinase
MFKKYWGMSAIRQAFILISIYTIVFIFCWLISNFFIQKKLIENIDRDLSYDLESINLLWQSQKSLALRPSQDSYYMIIPSPENYQGRIAEGAIFPGNLNEYGTGYHNIILIGETGVSFQARALIKLINDNTYIAARSLITQSEIRRTIHEIFFFSAIFSLIIITLVISVVSRNTQIRISKIENSLNYIKSGRLKTRIKLSGDDDLVKVSNSINETTQQLEDLMNQFKNQSANIAHDLKTPLTNLRLSLERKIISNKINKKEIQSSIIQIDEIINIFDTIIKIAKIQSGSERKKFIKVNLEDFGHEIFETYGPVIEDKGFITNLTTIKGSKIKMDKDLMFILITNLIQNSLKFAKKKTKITFEFGPDKILVKDQGPGIPINQKTKVTKPLYQINKINEGGLGLGLSMVKTICEIHKACLILENNGEGLTTGIWFIKKTK